jgi:predicted aminopeptidase
MLRKDRSLTLRHAFSVAWPLASVVLSAVTLLVVAGCESVGFYSQALSGQLSIMRRRQPVDELLEALRGAPDARQQRLLQQLELSRDILAFADAQVGLDVGNRYATYVQLQEPHVLWNVFAAPELSLSAHNWCYPLVGCAPYRGYFRSKRAQAYARKLSERGLETYVGEVAAYSTLGWFSDPLLSSFIFWPDADLAQLLLHELAHTQVWVASDVGFNEAFATFVGNRAARDFLARRKPQVLQSRSSAWPEMQRFLLDLRANLKRVYARDISQSAKRELKQRVYAQARSCYADHRGALGAGQFDSVVAQLNNAYLVSLTTYHESVGAFSQLFDIHDGDWARFFAAVNDLAELDPVQRSERVAELGQQQVARASNDPGTQKIQCETFLGHGIDGKSPRAEHDDVGSGSDGEHKRA